MTWLLTAQNVMRGLGPRIHVACSNVSTLRALIQALTMPRWQPFESLGMTGRRNAHTAFPTQNNML